MESGTIETLRSPHSIPEIPQRIKRGMGISLVNLQRSEVRGLEWFGASLSGTSHGLSENAVCGTQPKVSGFMPTEHLR